MRFFLLLLFLSSKFSYSQVNTIYYTPVNMPPEQNFYYSGSFDIKLLAEDLSSLLGQATGKKFSTQPFSGQKQGIFLVLDTTIHNKTNETGIVEIKNNSIIISSNYLTGISYGMYSWLNDLGFKFYLPGDGWNVIPNIKDLYRPFLKTYHPYFKLRNFTSSGRLLPVKNLDDNAEAKTEWFKWLRRNRMGADYIGIDGHRGEKFNSIFQTELEADSMMLAPINGKRQFSINAKLDPTNKKAFSAFVNWSVDRAKLEKKNNPYFLPYKKYTSVDMGDGLNYCHTPECEKEFASVSDQSITIANATAKKIKEIFPDAGVSTLAYTERADTPTIKIEPNVHVMVVPFAFQNVTTPADLMFRWSKKTPNISMYDFLNIPVWNYDMPFYNLNDYFKFLNYLKSLKIDGVSYETAYSKFGAGIQQYFILKYLCEPYSNPENLLDTFCFEMFGNAAKPVKEIFKEWYFSDVHLKTNLDNPSFYPDELGRFISKIEEAGSAKNLTSQQSSRIFELKAYIVYLCKYYELFQDPMLKDSFATDNNLKQKKADDLLNYIWSLYNNRIFQNTVLSDLLKPLSSDPQNWDYKKSNAFAKYSNDNNQIVISEFDKVKINYLPQAIFLPVLDSEIFKTLTPFSADSLRITTMDEVAYKKFFYTIPFYSAKPGILKIKYTAGETSASNEKNENIALISVESEDYFYRLNTIITKQNNHGELILQIPSAGYYKLWLGQLNSTKVEFIIYPAHNLLYLNKKSILSGALSLQESPGSIYPNSKLAFLSPGNNNLEIMPLKAAKRLTSTFYSGTKNQLTPDMKLFPKRVLIPFTDSQKSIFMYYSNEVYRWPPLFMNVQPYFFFLK